MKQVAVIWGMLAILLTPFILAAQEEHSSPTPGRGGAQSTDPVLDRIDNVTVGTVGVQARMEKDDDSDFWIGASCTVVDDALRSHLNLPAGSGLIIRRIADGSPAKFVGLRVHDVLTELSFGDETHKLMDTDQLTKLVQQTHGEAISLRLLRGGKPMTITMTPAERMTHSRSGVVPPHTQIDGFQPGARVRMTGPILAFGGASADLKDDLTVVITKSGRQPVEVVVHQKGRGEWKLKETESAEQPEYVSQAVVGVLAYLSRLVGSVEVRDGNPLFSLKPVGRTGGLGLQAGTPVRISTKIDRTAPGLLSVQQRLDEIQKEQERVTKALDELRKLLREHPSQN